MKTFGLQFLLACLVLPTALVRAERYDLDFEFVWNEEPSSLNQEQNEVRLTRCDYLLCKFAFQRRDSTWMEASRSLLGLINHQTGRTQLSLRNFTVTSPYVHGGRFDSLEEVIEHYHSGVQRSSTLDPNLAKHPTTGLEFTSDDKATLLAFLRTLTDAKLTQQIAN